MLCLRAQAPTQASRVLNMTFVSNVTWSKLPNPLCLQFLTCKLGFQPSSFLIVRIQGITFVKYLEQGGAHHKPVYMLAFFSLIFIFSSVPSLILQLQQMIDEDLMNVPRGRKDIFFLAKRPVGYSDNKPFLFPFPILNQPNDFYPVFIFTYLILFFHNIKSILPFFILHRSCSWRKVFHLIGLL